MPAISTRWEWRVFGPRLHAAERWLVRTPEHRGPGKRRDLLSLRRAAGIAKLRSGLMDIKVLREVDADGLERWEPVLKAGFPLQPSDVTRVFELLRLAPPTLSRAGWSVEEFIQRLRGSGWPVARGAGAQAAGPLRDRSLHARTD